MDEWSTLNNIAYWIGHAVCHQWPSHSYMAFGKPLPLCARCTGLYLGLMGTLGYILLRGGRTRRGWPSPRVMAVLFLFFSAWAVDGLNSFLAFLGWPHLYTPHNGLRLATGLLQGTVMGALMWPLFAQTTWGLLPTERVMTSWSDVLGALALDGLWWLAMQDGDGLRWGLGLFSILGVVIAFTLLVSVALRIFLRRVEKGNEDGGILLGVSSVLALVILFAIAAARYYWLD